MLHAISSLLITGKRFLFIIEILPRLSLLLAACRFLVLPVFVLRPPLHMPQKAQS
jgi:hypothetical protein